MTAERPQTQPARTYAAECLLQAELPHGARHHFALSAEAGVGAHVGAARPFLRLP